MRKVPLILFGLITISVLLLGLKIFAMAYTPLPKAEPEAKDNLPQLLHEVFWEEHLEENNEGHMNATSIRWSKSMDAIVAIGKPAVTRLIEAIETAHDRAESMTIDRFMRQQDFDRYAEMLQTKVAIILGRIGDDRATPVLTNLNCMDSRSKPYIDQAIKSIQEKEKESEVSR